MLVRVITASRLLPVRGLGPLGVRGVGSEGDGWDRGWATGPYRDAGRADEAIPLHEQTLADRERVLGTDHPDTVTTRNYLTLAGQDAVRAGED
jgi:Tetratricopeptide repeat